MRDLAATMVLVVEWQERVPLELQAAVLERVDALRRMPANTETLAVACAYVREEMRSAINGGTLFKLGSEWQWRSYH